MATYKDGKKIDVLLDNSYAPVDRERLRRVRDICDKATWPSWFDGLDAETRCNVMEVVLMALEQGIDE